MVRYLFYTIGDLTYQSPLVYYSDFLISGLQVIFSRYCTYFGLDRQFLTIYINFFQKAVTCISASG